jgi:hypothetical protein
LRFDDQIHRSARPSPSPPLSRSPQARRPPRWGGRQENRLLP